MTFVHHMGFFLNSKWYWTPSPPTYSMYDLPFTALAYELSHAWFRRHHLGCALGQGLSTSGHLHLPSRGSSSVYSFYFILSIAPPLPHTSCLLSLPYIIFSHLGHTDFKLFVSTLYYIDRFSNMAIWWSLAKVAI